MGFFACYNGGVETITVEFDAPSTLEGVDDSLQRLAWKGARPTLQLADLIIEVGRYSDILGLSAHSGEVEIIKKHIWESALLAFLIGSGFEGEGVDLGTGNGFPGLVLAAMLPSARFVLIEAGARRTAYLENAVKVAGLKNASVVHLYLGDVPDYLGERFDLVTHRAFSPIEGVIPLARQLGKKNHLLGGFGDLSDELNRVAQGVYESSKLLRFKNIHGNESFIYLQSSGAGNA